MTYEEAWRAVTADIAAVFERPHAEVVAKLSGGRPERRRYLLVLAKRAAGDDERYVRTGIAAKMLGVCGKTVARMVRRGDLRCIRTTGGNRRFALSELRAVKEVMEGRL